MLSIDELRQALAEGSIQSVWVDVNSGLDQYRIRFSKAGAPRGSKPGTVRLTHVSTPRVYRSLKSSWNSVRSVGWDGPLDVRESTDF